MRGVADGKQTGHDMVLAGINTGPQNRQAVRTGLAAIPRRDLLVGHFLAETAHVAQPARPNQGFTAFRGPVIFTCQALDLLQRQSISR